jgi:hypothetical protein
MSFLAEWHKQQMEMKDAERNHRKNATTLMNTYNFRSKYVQHRPGHGQVQDRERERRGARFPVAGEQRHEQDSINSITNRKAIFEKEERRKQKQKPQQLHPNCDDSNLNGNDNDDSVIIIQSLIRGYLCRTRVNKMLQKVIDEIQIEKTKRGTNDTETQSQTQTAAQHSSKTATVNTSTLIQVEDDKANVALSTKDVPTSTSTSTSTIDINQECITTESTSKREKVVKKDDGGGGDSDTIINEKEEEKKSDDDYEDDEDDVLPKMMIEEEKEKSNDDDDNNLSCCIFCLESPIKFDEYATIDCGSGCYHQFCISCIDQWQKKKANTCPYCRKTFHNIICVNDKNKSKKVDFREQQRYRQQQDDNGTIEDDDDDLLDVHIHIGGAEVGEGYTLRIDSGLSLVLPGNDNDYHVAYITE